MKVAELRSKPPSPATGSELFPFKPEEVRRRGTQTQCPLQIPGVRAGPGLGLAVLGQSPQPTMRLSAGG